MEDVTRTNSKCRVVTQLGGGCEMRESQGMVGKWLKDGFGGMKHGGWLDES